MSKLAIGGFAIMATMATMTANAAELQLTQEWDKTFPKSDKVESTVLLVHGEKAHSRYFSETAFKMLKGDNKELFIVPGAVHCDLYDGGDKDAIPFDKIEAFYKKNLK